MTEPLFTIAQAAPVPVITPGSAPAAPAAAPAAGTTATTAAPGAKPAAQQGDMSSALSSFALPVLMIVVFYFLLIRPQQKREKERQKQLKALEKGDKVLTRGGIFGTIVGLKPEENVAIVKIADDVKVEVSIATLENVVNKAS
ncbi:MAG: preprotein translocase subunit YajC [Turneriella sp.]